MPDDSDLPILSRNSKTRRSASFLPTPGMVVRASMSPDVTLEVRDRDTGEDGLSHLWTDARDGNKKPEDIAFLVCGKTEELKNVFAHMKVGQERYSRIDGAERCVR